MFQILSTTENEEGSQTDEIDEELPSSAVQSEPVDENNTDVPITAKRKSSEQFLPPRSRKRSAVSNDNNISAISNALDKLEKVSQQNENAAADEFDAFSQLIAIQLRQLPLIIALKCQEKIHSVIKEERLKVLLNNTGNYYTASPTSYSPSSSCYSNNTGQEAYTQIRHQHHLNL